MRGMKKWLPFKSLTGQYEVLDQMKKKRTEITKPSLSEDEIDDLNRSLNELKRGDNAAITFYHDHEIYNRQAIFIRCDPIEGKAFFLGLTISMGDLLNIRLA
jgi:uncharacterized protein (UPF0305 family)